MAYQSDQSRADTVIVVMDANRSKVSVEPLNWAMKGIVRPRDTVIVLGVLSEVGKKASSSSCLPFPMFNINLSGVSVKIEFSGHGEMTTTELEEEMEKKREEYKCTFHPFYRKCKMNEVKLQVKLAAGYDPRIITIEEAQNCNPRWIVLDGHLKKHRLYIYGHVTCNVAAMKGKRAATLTQQPITSSTSNYCQQWNPNSRTTRVTGFNDVNEEEEISQTEDLTALDPDTTTTITTITPPPTPRSPCWYPFSWRTGFPRPFSFAELEAITNGFANENLLGEEGEKRVYEGIYRDTPVVAKIFPSDDERFWAVLKILSRVRHCSVLNLVGYCSSDAALSLLFDYPCSGTIEMNLLCDETARCLSWRVRWYIALQIGIGVRYLHEECVDGPIVDLSVSSSSVVLLHGSTAMLRIVDTAKRLMDDIQDSTAECLNIEEDKRLLADVYDYGLFLVELITGKSAQFFQERGKGQSLIEWALPFLEDGPLNQVMDPRVMDVHDAGMVYHMANAALRCINNDKGRKISISEVLALVRGDQFAENSI